MEKLSSCWKDVDDVVGIIENEGTMRVIINNGNTSNRFINNLGSGFISLFFF